MAEENKVSLNDVEKAVSEYETANDAVADAQAALEKAQSERDAKKEAAQKSLNSLKERFENVGDAVEEVVSDTVQKVEEKLDAAKDEWAQLAMTDPDAARRQLRKFWILVAGGSGIVIGSVATYFLGWIF